MATSKKQSLEKDLAAKSARLFELEKAMASLSAAERVVSKESKDEGKAIESCSGELCLKVETGAAVRISSPLIALGNISDDKLMSSDETPGLVAIAGAVAAVWVFALVMEKRKALNL